MLGHAVDLLVDGHVTLPYFRLGKVIIIPSSSFHYRTEVQTVRKVNADLNTIIMEHMGPHLMHDAAGGIQSHIEDIVLELKHSRFKETEPHCGLSPTHAKPSPRCARAILRCGWKDHEACSCILPSPS